MSRQHLRISVFWMREGFKLQKMSILKFSDGIEIDISGELRVLELYDGWYVVGKGRLIPVKNMEEGERLLIPNVYFTTLMSKV